MSPEVEQHYLAAIVRQLERLAVDILAGDLWSSSANRQVPEGVIALRRQNVGVLSWFSSAFAVS